MFTSKYATSSSNSEASAEMVGNKICGTGRGLMAEELLKGGMRGTWRELGPGPIIVPGIGTVIELRRILGLGWRKGY